MKKSLCMGICAMAISNAVFAGTIGSTPVLSDPHFFIGIGGSYNSAEIEKQTIYGQGVNNTYTGPLLTGVGSAAGTSYPFYQSQNKFSPHTQAGYLRHVKESDLFWGIKLAYDYINVNLSNTNMTIPQAGSNYNLITGVTTDFSGNYAVDSVQTNINHEFLLLALIGHSFTQGNVYFGVGPTVFGMQNNIYHLIGYANYNGNPGTNVSGAPAYLSKTYWQWGGAAQLGATYTWSPSWFLDFSYTYARVAKNTIKYVSPFTNQIAVSNLVGTSYIHPSQREAVQSFGVSLNWVV